MTIIYCVSFFAGVNESTAHVAVEGIYGGDVSGIRTARVAGVTTAWFSVESDVEGTGTLGESDAERAVNAELDADDRVEFYTATV